MQNFGVALGIPRFHTSCRRVCSASVVPPCHENVLDASSLLLKIMFGDRQTSTLSDYIQSALMLCYNKRQVG